MGVFLLKTVPNLFFLEARRCQSLMDYFVSIEFFLTHQGTAWSREQLLREVWGEQHFVTPRTVDVHIRRLREQIEEKPDEPVFLTTVRGFGYRFEVK